MTSPLDIERLARMAEADNWLHYRRRDDDRWPWPVRLLIWAASVAFSFGIWVGLVQLLGHLSQPCDIAGSAAALFNCP